MKEEHLLLRIMDQRFVLLFALKQEYLAAVAAYIVGGGFHSLHEVIGPASYVLDLIPDYQVTVTDTKTLKTAPPPNYYAFYKLLTNNDPEFAEKREKSWQNYLAYFEKNYVFELLKKQLVEMNVERKTPELKSTADIAATLQQHQLAGRVELKEVSQQQVSVSQGDSKQVAVESRDNVNAASHASVEQKQERSTAVPAESKIASASPAQVKKKKLSTNRLTERRNKRVDLEDVNKKLDEHTIKLLRGHDKNYCYANFFNFQ